MKQALTIAIGLFLSLSAPLIATEEPPIVTNRYGYVNLGVGPAPLPIPQFGGGYRFQNGSNGFDANMQISTVVELTAVKASVNYLRYLSPDIKKQFYVGAGPALIEFFGRRDRILTAAPEIIFGKQYISDTGSQRHFQANIIWPIVDLNKNSHGWHKDIFMYPALSFSYGWGF